MTPERRCGCQQLAAVDTCGRRPKLRGRRRSPARVAPSRRAEGEVEPDYQLRISRSEIDQARDHRSRSRPLYSSTKPPIDHLALPDVLAGALGTPRPTSMRRCARSPARDQLLRVYLRHVKPGGEARLGIGTSQAAPPARGRPNSRDGHHVLGSISRRARVGSARPGALRLQHPVGEALQIARAVGVASKSAGASRRLVLADDSGAADNRGQTRIVAERQVDRVEHGVSCGRLRLRKPGASPAGAAATAAPCPPGRAAGRGRASRRRCSHRGRVRSGPARR